MRRESHRHASLSTSWERKMGAIGTGNGERGTGHGWGVRARQGGEVGYQTLFLDTTRRDACSRTRAIAIRGQADLYTLTAHVVRVRGGDAADRKPEQNGGTLCVQ